MYLFLDTSKEITSAKLFNEQLNLVDSISKIGQRNQSENLLVLIDAILFKNEIANKDLKGIFVISGPGSYTGLRVGVATANALAFVLGINVLGVDRVPSKKDLKKIETNSVFALPKYSYPPKITKEKPRHY